jgi:hypothetical protein
MFRKLRYKRWLVAGLGVAAMVVPTGATAAGSSRQYGPPDGWYGYAVSVTKQQQAKQYGPPDGWYTYAVSVTKQQQAGVALDGRSPDTRDAAFAAQAAESAPVDGRSPDTIDAAYVAQTAESTPVDGRSPDTTDAAVLAHNPVVNAIRTPAFQWGDFGIGGASALGALLLLGMSMRAISSRKNGKTGPLVTT